MTTDEPIAIVGAGIGGLSAGLALTRAGFSVRVYEQAPKLGEVGAGISLSPNAVKGLRYLGLESAIRAIADEPPQQITRHFETGEILVRIDRADTPERYGAPYLQAHRADLHRLLSDALLEMDPASIVLGKQLETIEETPGDVRLAFADDTNLEAAVVVGADGLKSRVRQQVFREDDPEFSGYCAWRGLIPRDRLRQMSLEPGSCVFVAPGRLFVRYPVRHGVLENFVAFTQTQDWQAESWSQTGDIAELQQHFSDFTSEVRQLLEAVSDGRCHKWGLFAREPLMGWVTQRVAVLGDAAHPMMPWFGQGAASAIEDGVILARAMTAAGGDRATGLQRYEAARHARVTSIHRESLLGGERLSAMGSKTHTNKPPKTEDSLGITEYDPATAAV